MKLGILKKTIGLEKQIESFLDRISESGLLFKGGVAAYLNHDPASFNKKLEDIADIEHAGDELRRGLEEQLYIHTLIPESRGDVLELIENMDVLLDRFKGALWRFDIEQPQFDDVFHDGLRELTACTVETVEATVISARAFFNDIARVADFLHKVPFWESQCDKLATQLQKSIFSQKDLHLAKKMQLRDFIRYIDRIADRAEDVSDKLKIYAIKRSI